MRNDDSHGALAALSVDARLAPLKRAHIFLMQYSTRRFPYGTEGRKNASSGENKGRKRAAASHCFMETNDFANSDAEKKHYCGIVFEWVQVGRPHRGIQLAELLRKNTEGGRKNVYVCGVRVILKNWTAAETIRAQVKAMRSMWQHRNRTLTWALAVFPFPLSIGTRLLTNELRRNGIKL